MKKKLVRAGPRMLPVEGAPRKKMTNFFLFPPSILNSATRKRRSPVASSDEESLPSSTASSENSPEVFQLSSDDEVSQDEHVSSAEQSPAPSHDSSKSPENSNEDGSDDNSDEDDHLQNVRSSGQGAVQGTTGGRKPRKKPPVLEFFDLEAKEVKVKPKKPQTYPGRSDSSSNEDSPASRFFLRGLPSNSANKRQMSSSDQESDSSEEELSKPVKRGRSTKLPSSDSETNTSPKMIETTVISSDDEASRPCSRLGYVSDATKHSMLTTPPITGNGVYNWPWLE